MDLVHVLETASAEPRCCFQPGPAHHDVVRIVRYVQCKVARIVIGEGNRNSGPHFFSPPKHYWLTLLGGFEQSCYFRKSGTSRSSVRLPERSGSTTAGRSTSKPESAGKADGRCWPQLLKPEAPTPAETCCGAE
ncbi:hypothetical protein AHiyo8_11790 [Arthrobacter sp. Hiyo8]|nr:hypothetical protein AHiyo8_11790 [Arthrobacter sp. Hiyo8]